MEGRAYQNVVNELVLPEGTFFDACPIHAISTATLAQLRRLEPSLDFAVERFRPNLLIEPEAGAEGFVEEAWAGHTLRLGTGPPQQGGGRHPAGGGQAGQGGAGGGGDPGGSQFIVNGASAIPGRREPG